MTLACFTSQFTGSLKFHHSKQFECGLARQSCSFKFNGWHNCNRGISLFAWNTIMGKGVEFPETFSTIASQNFGCPIG